MPLQDKTVDRYELKGFHDSLDDLQVLVVQAVLLAPPERVFDLLAIQYSNLWNSARTKRPGLPTYKTIQKLLVSPEKQSTPGTQSKLLRNLPTSARATRFMISEFEQGYATPSLYAWLGMLELGNVLSEHALDYWQDIFCELSRLSGPTLRSQSTLIDRYKAYDTSSVTRRLGCPISRDRLPGLLEELGVEADVESSTTLKMLLVADGFAALLRLAAWLMAQWQVDNWALQEREGTQNTMLADWAIPVRCPSSGIWSCPMEEALSKLAKLNGWTGKPKAVTYLGKLWASIDNKPQSSRIRLLRNWVQLRPDRPSFEMLTRLVGICMDKHFEDAGVPLDERGPDCWLSASVFRFAETTSRLVRDWEKAGYPQDLICSITGVYRDEYRTARAVLGKPLAS